MKKSYVCESVHKRRKIANWFNRYKKSQYRKLVKQSYSRTLHRGSSAADASYGVKNSAIDRGSVCFMALWQWSLLAFICFFQKSCHELLSNTPFRRLDLSVDALCLTRVWGVSIWGGGSGEKETTITVKLSQVLRLRASLTSSLEHLSGSLCSINSFLAIVTAHWLLMTSHRPSQPMIRNSSSSDNISSCNSGSALKGQAEPFGPFICQSPNARATDSWPFKYPLYMAPPSFSILCLSDLLSGLWSLESSMALPRLPKTARQSPALAITNFL